MKIKEIAKKYGLDIQDFNNFLDRNPEKQKFVHWEWIVEDENVPQVVKEYKAEVSAIEKEEREKRIREQEKEMREQEKLQALPSILITSGFNFDGYKIVKYSGYISGDDATQIPRSGIFGGNNGENLTDALVKIRIQAIKELKEAAYDLGCNAVIGVDFDYITLEPETAGFNGGTVYEPYVICVTANGNAVVIEKN